VLALWLPGRISWIAAASAAQRLLRSGADGGEDLFALRGLARQPLNQLARAGGTADLMAGWRARDPDTVRALARLELDELGLRAPAR
jgi:hypothetical protein